jgi:hypothetical protein
VGAGPVSEALCTVAVKLELSSLLMLAGETESVIVVASRVEGATTIGLG